MRRRLLAVAAGLTLVVVGVTAGVAMVQGPVHACAKTAGDGDLRMVAGPEDCKGNETYLRLASYDDLAALAGQVSDLEARVDALENPPGPVLPDPVAYWSFDDLVSPTADGADGHDADVMGALFETGDIAPISANVGALSFDGTDDYAWTPDPGGADNLDGFAGLTLAAWVKPDVLGSPWDNWRMIVSKYDTQDADSISYWLLLRGDEAEIFVSRQRVVNEDRLASSGVDLQPGEWVHVAGTWDGSQLKLYVNGTQVAAKATSVSTMDDSNLQVDIGAAEKVTGFGGRAGFFDGLIDEVYIFDQALSAAEIGVLASG